MKQTEIGVIPQDWGLRQIKEIASIKTGTRNTQDRVIDGEYPFFVRSQTVERINSFSYDGEAILTAGDGVGVGKVIHYIKGKFDFHQRVYCITEFNPEIHGRYFFKYFQANFLNRIMQMTAKSSVDSVRMDMIAEMQIPIPRFSEQQAIAEALSDADAWIESLALLIEKKRLIKQGAMQELLQPKKGWKQTTFDEAFYFLRTASYSRADLNSDGYAGYIHYGDIHTKWSNILDVQKSTLPKISEEMLKSHSLVKSGDIIMADASEDYSGVGKSIEVINIDDAKIIAGLHTFLLRQKSDLFSPKFFGYFIHSKYIKIQLDTLATGLKVYSISKSALKQVEILYPTADEQARITSILSEMDSELEILEQKLSKAGQIKQGMMQQLLTGKIRLVRPANAKAAKTLKRVTA